MTKEQKQIKANWRAWKQWRKQGKPLTIKNK